MTVPPLSRPILVNTGPLVAWLDRSDADHGLCRRFFANVHGPLLSTWAVLIEVCHLVPNDVAPRFLAWIQLGVLQRIEIPPAALETISSWMMLTKNLPMELADATLLWAAHQRGLHRIATLDRRNFGFYRLPGGQGLENVLEAG